MSTLTATRPTHDRIARALAVHATFTDLGDGFLAPEICRYRMSDAETLRWLADRGVVL